MGQYHDGSAPAIARYDDACFSNYCEYTANFTPPAAELTYP
jgi:hypothetical protein